MVAFILEEPANHSWDAVVRLVSTQAGRANDIAPMNEGQVLSLVAFILNIPQGIILTSRSKVVGNR